MIDIWILRISPQKKFYNIDHLCCWTLRGKIEGKKLTFSDFCCSIRAESAFYLFIFVLFRNLERGRWGRLRFGSRDYIGPLKDLQKWTKVRPELFLCSLRRDELGIYEFGVSVFPECLWRSSSGETSSSVKNQSSSSKKLSKCFK